LYSFIIIDINIIFYREIINIIDNSGVIPRNQLLIIDYNSIRNGLWGTVQKIKDFANLQFSPELENKIKQQHEKQPSYKRPHKNLPLEAFNLSEEKLRTDFNFFFKTYNS